MKRWNGQIEPADDGHKSGVTWHTWMLIDWQAIAAKHWQQHKEGKQAEFLVENSFSWNLVRRIGVHSRPAHVRVVEAMRGAAHRPNVEILPNWYYGKGERAQ